MYFLTKEIFVVLRIRILKFNVRKEGRKGGNWNVKSIKTR